VDAPGTLEKLKTTLPFLSNLVELDACQFQGFNLVVKSVGHLVPLTRGLEVLTLPNPGLTYAGVLDTTNLRETLHPLQSLAKLTIKNWEVYESTVIGDHEFSSFPQVEILQIQGEGAEDSSVTELVGLFPSIVDLALHTMWRDSSLWTGALSDLPKTLVSLSLFAEYDHVLPAESLLTQYESLRRIHLGSTCFSSFVDVTLRQLPLLEEIRLGNGLIDAKAFLSLVTGSSRLVHLRNLILDLDDGHFGLCIAVEDSEVMVEKNEDGETEWELPGYLEEGSLDRVGLAKVVVVAESSGVKVEGTVLKALKVLKLHCVDSNNRAILAYSGPADLRRLHEIRMEALRYNYKLPALDFDSLERDKLEIVETKLPGTGWSVFGFRDKEK